MSNTVMFGSVEFHGKKYALTQSPTPRIISAAPFVTHVAVAPFVTHVAVAINQYDERYMLFFKDILPTVCCAYRVDSPMLNGLPATTEEDFKDYIETNSRVRVTHITVWEQENALCLCPDWDPDDEEYTKMRMVQPLLKVCGYYFSSQKRHEGRHTLFFKKKIDMDKTEETEK